MLELKAEISAKASNILASFNGLFSATEYSLKDMTSGDADGSLLLRFVSFMRPTYTPFMSSWAGHWDSITMRQVIIMKMVKMDVWFFIANMEIRILNIEIEIYLCQNILLDKCRTIR